MYVDKVKLEEFCMHQNLVQMEIRYGMMFLDIESSSSVVKQIMFLVFILRKLHLLCFS
jgi:hypothetical protein